MSHTGAAVLPGSPACPVPHTPVSSPCPGANRAGLTCSPITPSAAPAASVTATPAPAGRRMATRRFASAPTSATVTTPRPPGETEGTAPPASAKNIWEGVSLFGAEHPALELARVMGGEDFLWLARVLLLNLCFCPRTRGQVLCDSLWHPSMLLELGTAQAWTSHHTRGMQERSAKN